jgi:hypothetical protein
LSERRRLGRLTLAVTYAVDEFEGMSAHVSVATEEELGLFRALYQVGDRE